MARKALGIRRNLKEEQRRKQITEAAVRLFSTKGYDRTTMDDIVVEAGCSKSLIYWYYKSKGALFGELLDKCMSEISLAVERAANEKADFRKSVSRLLAELRRNYRENEALWRMVHFGSIRYSDSAHDNFREQLAKHSSDQLKLLAKFLRKGIKEGVLRPDLDAPAIALYLLSVVTGHIYHSIVRDDPAIGVAGFDVLENQVFPGMMID